MREVRKAVNVVSARASRSNAVARSSAASRSSQPSRNGDRRQGLSTAIGLGLLALSIVGVTVVFGVLERRLAAFADEPAKGAVAPAEAWIPLFNGKDLEGWTPKIRGYALGENFGDTFRVENGVLKVAYDKYDKFNDRFGHLFYKSPYSRYRLRVEYRFTGEQVPGGPGWAVRNSGVMVHGEDPKRMSRDQDFPASIEVQLLGGSGSGTRTTANLCTPGTNVVMNGELVTRHCTNSKSKTYHGDQWVTAEIEVLGGETIRHLVDGQVVLEYQQPQLDDREAHARELIEANGGKLLTGGSISLQSESHPVEFRKVEILPLK